MKNYYGGKICERGRFKPRLKRWGGHRWQKWWISRGRGCDRCGNRWVRDRETWMRLTERSR